MSLHAATSAWLLDNLAPLNSEPETIMLQNFTLSSC